MTTVLTATFIILCFVLVRSADLAIVAGRANDVIRAICYGIVALFAMIVVVLQFVH